MRKILVYMMLFVHMNTFMLFPALPGVHIVDITDNGQVDPINTALEYFDQLVLEHDDDTPEQETSKHPRFVSVEKANYCVFYQAIISPEIDHSVPFTDKLNYIIRHDNIGPVHSYDIVAPPPEVA